MNTRTPLPSVTVIIPTLDSELVLEAALRSLHEQQYAGAIEILCIDGGSVDGTRELARRFGAAVLHNEAGDTPEARAIGVEAASGELLLFLDADDELPHEGWLPHLVEALWLADDVVSADCLYHTWRRQDPALTRLCGLIGGVDPLAVELGFSDRWAIPLAAVDRDAGGGGGPWRCAAGAHRSRPPPTDGVERIPRVARRRARNGLPAVRALGRRRRPRAAGLAVRAGARIDRPSLREGSPRVHGQSAPARAQRGARHPSAATRLSPAGRADDRAGAVVVAGGRSRTARAAGLQDAAGPGLGALPGDLRDLDRLLRDRDDPRGGAAWPCAGRLCRPRLRAAPARLPRTRLGGDAVLQRGRASGPARERHARRAR